MLLRQARRNRFIMRSTIRFPSLRFGNDIKDTPGIIKPGLFTGRDCRRCEAQGMKLWYFTANALQQSFIARPAEQAVATLDG
jgi:hypothetical protein